MPPARSGVADYSAMLLPYLRAQGKVELEPGRASVRLYHLGNNQLHREIYQRALTEPGVVVLHDAVLHHFFLGCLTPGEYVEEFVYNYGEWSRGLAATLWAERARSASDVRYFRYPMLRRIAQASRAIIVHNPAAGAMVRAHVRDARVVEIPHAFEPPPGFEHAEQFTREPFVAGVFGHLRESKRIMSVLRVFRRLRGEQMTLLLAGDFASQDLARAVSPSLDEPWLKRVPYAPGRRFWELAARTTVCINLRYPPAGETSGIGTGMMGIGRAVVATRGREIERIPESACLRIDAGLAEEAQLEHVLLWLSRHRRDSRDIGRMARDHIRNHHDPRKAAQAYWRLLEESSC